MGCGSQWTLKNLRVLPRLSLRSLLRFPLRLNPRSVLRSVSRSVSRSVLRSVSRSVPCFILFIVDKRRLRSIFWSLLTIVEQVLHQWSHTDAQGWAKLSANSSQLYTKLNYTKQLVLSRRSRTREQSKERSGARMKTENETGEGLFPSPSRFWENWQTDKRADFAQPTSDFCFQRLDKLVLAIQTNAGHLGFQRCITIIPALWRDNLVKFNP